MFYRIFLFTLLLTLIPVYHVSANDIHPLEPADTSSPQDTYRYFIEQMNKAYDAQLNSSYHNAGVKKFISKAMKCLDLSEVANADRGITGIETVLLLKEVIDRIPTPTFDEIPDLARVKRDKIDFYVVPHTAIRIMLKPDGPRKGEFLFSSTTVEDAMEFYNQVKYLPYKPGSSVRAYEYYLSQPGPMIPKSLMKHLPPWMTFRIWGAAIWQHLTLLFAFLMIGAFIFGLNRFVRVEDKTESENNFFWTLRRLLVPVSLLTLLLLLKYFAEEQIGITGHVWVSFKNIVRFVYVIILAWAISTVGKGITEAVIKSKRTKRTGIDPNIMRMLFRLLTILILFLVLLNASEYFGISVNAVFASAGLVGMAAALAARETISNIFGGISLLLDHPFKNGDYITIDTGERGKVLQVGLRSTRILTRDDIQITIPNSIITNTKIVNESAPRDDSRVHIKVGVAYGSDLLKVEEILLRLASEEKLVKKTPAPSVMLRGFGTSSVDFELLCYAYWAAEKGLLVHSLNWSIYMAFKESDIVIPFPQRDIHIKNGGSSIADKVLTHEQL
jgi:MscS family membrane protein